jgi:hypothetical protein
MPVPSQRMQVRLWPWQRVQVPHGLAAHWKM